MSSIEFNFEDIYPFEFKKKLIVNHIKELINKELKDKGDLAIIFCSDDYLLEMNKQYLDHDYYTDIITFDYVENNIISGDLFISYDRIKENSEKLKITFIRELYRVIFHGVLHLVGYNDKTDDEQKIMTEKENYYLSEVDFSGKEL